MTPAEALPSRRPVPSGAVAVWVIYDHPKDYPHAYVLRAQFVLPDGLIVADPVEWFADDPEKLRAILPGGLVKMMPMVGDDPVILETWL